MSRHYVTHIKVERVDIARKPPARGQAGIEFPGDAVRTVTEVGSVTVKAPTIAVLAQRAGAHLDLFTDPEADQ